jgi:hypothetical protein
VEANEALGPFGVTILGARRVVADAECAAEPVKQARRLREGQLAQLGAQETPVKEGKRAMGFFQRTKGGFLCLGKMLEKASDLGNAQFARMAFVVEEDEKSSPAGKALAGLRPAKVVEGSLTELIE